MEGVGEHHQQVGFGIDFAVPIRVGERSPPRVATGLTFLSQAPDSPWEVGSLAISSDWTAALSPSSVS